MRIWIRQQLLDIIHALLQSAPDFAMMRESLQTALDRAEKELTENPDSIDEEVIIDIKTKLAKIKRKESYEKNRKNHW